MKNKQQIKHRHFSKRYKTKHHYQSHWLTNKLDMNKLRKKVFGSRPPTNPEPELSSEDKEILEQMKSTLINPEPILSTIKQVQKQKLKEELKEQERIKKVKSKLSEKDLKKLMSHIHGQTLNWYKKRNRLTNFGSHPIKYYDIKKIESSYHKNDLDLMAESLFDKEYSKLSQTQQHLVLFNLEKQFMSEFVEKEEHSNEEDEY